MIRIKFRLNGIILLLVLFSVLLVASSSIAEMLESSTISFGCFGDNCQNQWSCCYNQGGDHCNPYNEGTLTFSSTINPNNVISATISLTNYNTQSYSSRYLDYFISTSSSAQYTGVEILSNHEVPGTSSKTEDPLEIDITNTIKSLGASSTYYFGVLNDDYWEVTVNNIKLVVETGQSTTTTTATSTPTSFDDITLDHIRSASLSSSDINGSNNEYNQIPAGTILVYKTNGGRYGKMEILTYGYDLTVKYVTYSSSGSVFSSSSLTIMGTWNYDMDYGTQSSSSATDFKWNQVDNTTRYIVPKNGATFAVYQTATVTTSTTPATTIPPTTTTTTTVPLTTTTVPRTTTTVPLTTTTVPLTTTTVPLTTTTVPATTTIPSTITVDFIASPSYGTAPLMVSFINLSSGDISSYSWNFGDGSTSTEANPTHTYTNVGSYSVVLTAYAADGTSKQAVKANAISVEPPIPCIMMSTLDDTDDIKTLRALRGSMLKNIFGIILTSIYYRNSAEVTSILADSPELRDRLKDLVTENIGIAEELASGDGASVSAGIIADAIEFLDDLKAEASPKLQNNIDFLIKGIEDGYLLNGISISTD